MVIAREDEAVIAKQFAVGARTVAGEHLRTPLNDQKVFERKRE
jgi:hypothetical protein